jgi:hypothetical protein
VRDAGEIERGISAFARDFEWRSDHAGRCVGVSAAKPPIEVQVIACHHVGGEPLLEHLAHYPAVKLTKLEDRPTGKVPAAVRIKLKREIVGS